MMANDEVATLEKLRRYRVIMNDLFASHEGRQVNTWGDSVIGEFTSVVEAVRCAVEIQDAINADNRDLPKTEQMRFRIGINLGDVMEDDGDIYGDGVNVAARLEALADPGGIMVSENVYQLSHKQLAIEYDYAGSQSVKTGEDPISGYRVRIGGSNRTAEFVQTTQTDEQTATEPNVNSKPRMILLQIGNYIDRFLNWYPEQSKSVKSSAMTIGVLATINILFTGIASPWFLYPSLPLAAYIYFKTRGNK